MYPPLLSSSWPLPPTSRVITAPTDEPLTLDEAKLRANLDWVAGDPRDALMEGFISTARARVEIDTALALLTQTREVYADSLGCVFELPAGCKPLANAAAVSGITYTDQTGLVQTVDPAVYVVDPMRARLVLAPGKAWPTAPARLLALPYVITVTAGWPTPADLPPILLQLVGILVAHLATLGRDLATVDPSVVEVPYTYCDLLDSYRAVSVA